MDWKTVSVPFRGSFILNKKQLGITIEPIRVSVPFRGYLISNDEWENGDGWED